MTENSWSRLGLLGTIGFCWLIAFAIFRSAMPGPEIEHSREFSALSSLTLTLLLVSTVGGIGSLFNVFVSPAIRCYNRSSVFIAFYSLAAFAMLLNRRRMFQRIRDGIPPDRTSLPPLALLGGLLVFCVFDQDMSSVIHRRRADIIALHDMQKDFVERVESHLSPGSRVYQIPFADYPNTTGEEMHLAAYLLSQNGTRWSWPAITAEARAWNRSLDPLSAVDFVGKLRDAGFAGLWVDRHGFDPQTLPQLEAGLQEVLGNPVETTKDRRYAFYLVNSDRSSPGYGGARKAEG
jgi:phosphoglycerol transferase